MRTTLSDLRTALAVAVGLGCVGGLVPVVACGGKTTLEVNPPPSASTSVVSPPTAPPTFPPPPQPDPPPPEPDPDPEPPPLLGSLPPNTCLTFLGSIFASLRLATIDLVTGAVTKGISVKLSEDFTYDPSSIALVGDEVLFCEVGRITRISRADGSAKFIQPHGCQAITADGTGIYVLEKMDKPIRHFATLDDLRTNQWDKELPALPAIRLGVSPAGLLASMHSTRTLFTPSGSVLLEGYDDWVDGLAGVPGRILVSSPRATGDRPGLLFFDAVTGKRVGAPILAPNETLNSGLGFKGLACAY
ncbi:MAG: hypothetical protein JST00_20715 [Deltaproteobacteria bacterium]|nr:hypothetical protein [Deltaproteobacteria bacterium]